MYRYDRVLLVNNMDAPNGTADKLEAHRLGLLHRAFSIFIINNAGEILLQRRANTKYHSSDLWANTCCGHPQENESILIAASRRLNEEMGLICELRAVGNFYYKEPVGQGLIEHEIDHLFVGKFNGIPISNSSEVSEWRFLSMNSIEFLLEKEPENFAAWFPIAFCKVRPYLDL